MKIYIVGGAVRDELLGLKPKDVDYLVTGATPEEMIALGFEQVGADFPVFLGRLSWFLKTEPQENEPLCEFALARIERKTGDGYHGFAVDFDTSVTVEEDLSRRDLTINAMAKDIETGEIIDPFGGRYDLEAKVLRHVSPAFAEDPLRVVRLARFAARYFGFTIANSTMVLARQMVADGELNHLPNERFWAEMEKALGEDVAGHFFHVLDIMGAYEHVKFFNELFEFDHVAMTHTGFAVKRHCKTSEERLMFFTALRAKQYAETVASAPVRTQRLHLSVDRFRRTNERKQEVTANTVFNLFVLTKAWSQSNDFGDLVRAIEMMEEMQEEVFIGSKQLADIAEATKVVAASQFPEVQGKALGEAIANARLEIVAASFNAKNFTLS